MSALTHISRKELGNYNTGYTVKAELAPLDWFHFLSQPDSNNEIQSLHVLKEGYSFIECYVLHDSIEGLSETYGDVAAHNKTWSPSFFLPGDKADLQSFIDALINEPLVLLLHDVNGHTVQFGTDKNPLFLSSTQFGSGKVFEGVKGYKITCKSTNRYFYNYDATLTEKIISRCAAFDYPVDEEGIIEEVYYAQSPILRDKTSFNLFPCAYAANVVYALDSLLFPHPVSFSRASQGTRYNKLGVPELVAANYPRIQHDPVTKEVTGYLCEPASTNLLTRSESTTLNLGSQFWGSYGCYHPTVISGSYGPYREYTISESVGYGEKRIINGNGGYVGTSPITQTLSFQVKANGRSKVRTVNSTVFDLETGLMSGGGSSTSKFYPVGDGWFQIETTWTVNDNNAYWVLWIVDSLDISSISYNGDGVSGVKLRMVQIENKPFATSYIPTYDYQATRLAETFSYTSLQSKGQQAVDKGTFFIDTPAARGKSANTDYGIQLLQSGDLTGNHFAFAVAPLQWTHQYKIGSALTNILSATGGGVKVANQFGSEVLKQYYDGVRILDTAYVGTVYLSGFNLGGANMGIHLKHLAFFYGPLLNAELTEITS